MRSTLADREDCAVDESAHPLDDVPVGQHYSNYRSPSSRGRCGDECALAFEDTDQPVEVVIVHKSHLRGFKNRVNGLTL